LNHFSGFSIDLEFMKENLGDSITLVPNLKPIQNIAPKPTSEPRVENIASGKKPTSEMPTSVPMNTKIVSQGAGGKIFSRNVIKKANISTEYHGTFCKKFTDQSRNSMVQSEKN